MDSRINEKTNKVTKELQMEMDERIKIYKEKYFIR
jgi:hypothetical protein